MRLGSKGRYMVRVWVAGKLSDPLTHALALYKFTLLNFALLYVKRVSAKFVSSKHSESSYS